MKYGILYRKTTMNIGDDIQAYAASQWLPSVDYIVNIEAMDEFVAENDEPVATIMSAWYMWRKWHWPPSKNIYPLWIGLHFTDGERGNPRGMPAKYEYLADGPGKEYLQSFEPIGCRDKYTQNNLNKLGIKNYFSGCVTLTLQPRKRIKPEREYVVLVDVDKKAIRYIKKFYADKNIDVKVMSSMRHERSTEIIWEDRKAQVEEMLDIYQNAKCVITFRLHCALPCTAMEVPVYFCRSDYSSPRIKTYMDYVRHTTPAEICAGKLDEFLLNPTKNPDDYKVIRNGLIKTITEWVEECKKETRTATELARTTYTDEDVKIWRSDKMFANLDTYDFEHHEDRLLARQNAREIARLKAKVEEQEKVIRKQKNRLKKKGIPAADEDVANAEFMNSKIGKTALKIRNAILKMRRLLKNKK